MLVSIRFAQMRAFTAVTAEYHKLSSNERVPIMALLTIVDTISDSCAEILEQSVDEIDKLAGDIFGHRLRGKRKAPKYLEDRVARFVGFHRLLSKVRDSLLSLSRLMSYINTKRILTEG